MNAIESAIGSKDSADKITPLETVELCTGEDPSAAVIWLHGLGADGHDFEPAVPQLLWPGAPSIRFVFPHAAIRPVTVNGGMRMRAWYDILGFSSDRDHDEAGIAESMSQVTGLIDREQRRGIAPERVVLAGFSQGGAIAIQVALRYPRRLAGLIAISTYLLRADRIQAEAHPVNINLPVFMGHGSMDPVVPFKIGEEAARKLREIGSDLEWHSYPMTHAVNAEEIGDIRTWISQRLA